MNAIVCTEVPAWAGRGAALYLGSGKPIYSCGQMNGGLRVEVQMRNEGRLLSRLVLAERRGHIVYAEREKQALQRAADSVAEALAIASLIRPMGSHPINR